MASSGYTDGISSYLQDLEASPVERSKFLQEYNAARPQSAGTRPRSIIHRFGRQLAQAEDCDVDGEPEVAAWVLDGWGDEPSVPEKAQLNSCKISKYSKDIPSALPNAAPRRALSAGGNRPGNQRTPNKPIVERKRPPQQNPRPKQQVGSDGGSRSLGPSPDAPPPVQRPLDGGDESDGDSRRCVTPPRPSHLPAASASASAPPSAGSDPASRPKAQGRSSAGTGTGGSSAAASPIHTPRSASYVFQALNMERPPSPAGARAPDRARATSSPLHLSGGGGPPELPGRARQPQQQQQQPASTWNGEGMSSRSAGGPNGPTFRVLTLTQAPPDASGLMPSSSPLLGRRTSGSGAGAGAAAGLPAAGAKKPPAAAAAAASRRAPQQPKAAQADSGPLGGWEDDPSPARDSQPGEGEGRGRASGTPPDMPPRPPGSGARAYSQQVSLHAALAVAGPSGSSSSLGLKVGVGGQLGQGVLCGGGQAATEIMSRLSQGVLGGRGSGEARPSDAAAVGPPQPCHSEVHLSHGPGALEEILSWPSSSSGTGCQLLQKHASAGTTRPSAAATQGPGPQAYGLGPRKGSGGMLEVGSIGRRMPA